MDEIPEGCLRGERVKPDAIRVSETYDIKVMGVGRAHVTVSRYPHGDPCEIFINVSKVGSDLRTSFEAWAMMASKALQYGVPMDAVARTIRGIRSDHGGKIQGGGEATSLWDAIAQELENA